MEETTVKISVPTRIRNFVDRHQTGIAVAATTIVAGALQVRTASNFNGFLKEKDLYDEYYCQGDFEE